jgi:hypothetical protein
VVVAMAARTGARTWFEPAFGTYAGRVVPGVQFHVGDRATYEPVRTELVMLRVLNELCPEFAWRQSLDQLWGPDSLRKAPEAGADPLMLLPSATLDRVRPGVLRCGGTPS